MNVYYIGRIIIKFTKLIHINMNVYYIGRIIIKFAKL